MSIIKTINTRRFRFVIYYCALTILVSTTRCFVTFLAYSSNFIAGTLSSYLCTIRIHCTFYTFSTITFSYLLNWNFYILLKLDRYIICLLHINNSKDEKWYCIKVSEKNNLSQYCIHSIFHLYLIINLIKKLFTSFGWG